MRTSLALVAALLLCAATAAAQSFVTFDDARLYAEADYLSDVIDTLALGDTVFVLEKEKKFVRVKAGDREGWMLAANVGDRAPRVAAKKTAAPKTAESKATAPPTDESAPTASTEIRAERPVTTPAASEAPAAQCAGVTKTGKQCSRKAGSGSAYCWQHAK